MKQSAAIEPSANPPARRMAAHRFLTHRHEPINHHPGNSDEMNTKTLLALSLSLIIPSAYSAPTNNPTPGTIGVTVDPSGNLLQPPNFFTQNAASLAVAASSIPATNTANNLWPGSNNFAGQVIATNTASNVISGTLSGAFSGNGAGATNLNAASLASGTIPNGVFPATLPAASGANLTTLPAASLTGQVAIANGGSGANALAGGSGARKVFGGSQNLPSDNSVIPTIANFASLTGDFIGQMATSRYQLAWWDGANWRGTIDFVDSIICWSTNQEAGIFVVSNGVDNVISLQNNQANHFSATRFKDRLGNEVGAIGYGNDACTIYRTNLYYESFGTTFPIWFSGSGYIMGGMEGVTGDFVWWNQPTGAATNNYASLQQLFRIHRANGAVTINSNLTVNGSASIGNGGLSVASSITFGAQGGVKTYGIGSGFVDFMDGGGVDVAGACSQGLALNSGGITATLVSKSSSYALTTADSTVLVTATGQTMTLPTAVGNMFKTAGRIYTIKLTASGSCTIATTSSQTIDGSSTYSLSAQNRYVTVQSDGSNWQIIGNN